MSPPSLSVAAICAQLDARLPVPFCPARGGREPYMGAQIRDYHTNTYTLSLSLFFFLWHTNPHTFCSQLPSSTVLPLGLGGVSTQQYPPQSLLSCPVMFCLLCSLLSALRIDEGGGSRSSVTLIKLFRGHSSKAHIDQLIMDWLRMFHQALRVILGKLNALYCSCYFLCIWK